MSQSHSNACQLTYPKGSPLYFSRVLLISCPTGTYCREDRCQSFFKFELVPSMRPPMEECEAAGAVASVGATSIIIDAPAEQLSEEACIERVRLASPDLVVMAVTFGSLDADLSWAKRIKEILPGVTIALRGAPCYVWSERILKQNSVVDLCLRGDYELVLQSLTQNGPMESVGVVKRNLAGDVEVTNSPHAEDLDSLPLPDRSGLNSKLYTVRSLGASQATVHVQRGCPFPCTYCLVHTVSGSKPRHRSPQSVASEIQSLQKSGINYFYLRAETFTVNRRWAISLCHELQKSCPKARWVTTTRVECVDDELLLEMRKAGCYGISFGVDVASPTIGAHVKKPVKEKEAREAMRLCDKHGIISLAYIMIGFVWETEETLKEASKFIKAIRPNLLTVHFAHPYPGTPYYEAVQSQSAKVVSLHAQSEPALELPGISVSDLTSHARKMLLRQYSNPKTLLLLAKKLFILRTEYLIFKLRKAI